MSIRYEQLVRESAAPPCFGKAYSPSSFDCQQCDFREDCRLETQRREQSQNFSLQNSNTTVGTNLTVRATSTYNIDLASPTFRPIKEGEILWQRLMRNLGLGVSERVLQELLFILKQLD